MRLDKAGHQGSAGTVYDRYIVPAQAFTALRDGCDAIPPDKHLPGKERPTASIEDSRVDKECRCILAREHAGSPLAPSRPRWRHGLKKYAAVRTAAWAGHHAYSHLLSELRLH